MTGDLSEMSLQTVSLCSHDKNWNYRICFVVVCKVVISDFIRAWTTPDDTVFSYKETVCFVGGEMRRRQRD